LAKLDKYSPPDDALEALARCLYPAMAAYFESEEGRREFAEWQARQAAAKSPSRDVVSGEKAGQAA